MIRPNSTITLLAAVLATLSAVTPGHAQTPRPATPAAPAAAASTPARPAVPELPQQTSATYADWVLRCTQLQAGRLCEVVQAIQRDDKTVAQIAFGRPIPNQGIRLTMVVPTSIAIASAPRLLPGVDGDAAPVVTLAWRRCLPSGCFADAAPSGEALAKMRSWTDPGRIALVDGTDQNITLPFSPRGLTQALDAMSKEDAVAR